MSVMPPKEFYHVTQNHIVNVDTQPKFGNSSITMREVIITLRF